MSQDTDVRAADPVLGRLADAILIPPFPGPTAPGWMLGALGRGLAGVTLFGQNVSAPGQVSALTTALRAAAAGDDPVIAIDEEGGEDEYLAVREALVAAVRDGALDGARLEEAADRVARLRGGLARTRWSGAAAGAGGQQAPGVGLAAARRAVRVSGPRRTLTRPVIIEVEPRENIAAGRFGWGLGPWAPPGSVHRVSSAGRPLDSAGLDTAGILAAAAGRSLLAVVRDAHRDEPTRSLVSTLLAARPDLVLLEMGLPLWHPPEGTSYLATYGASRASAHAAAEVLGLA